jgi:hypothetical protein
LPVSYIIAGEPEKEYSRDDFQDPMAQMGIKKQITTYFPLRTFPSLIMCNLKVSKDIGKRYRLSFFANNFLNIRPWHLDQRSGRYERRNEKPFFGADLTMEL